MLWACPHGRRRPAETLAVRRATASVLALAAPTAASTAAVTEAEHLSHNAMGAQPIELRGSESLAQPRRPANTTARP